ELFWLDETLGRRWITELRRDATDLARQVVDIASRVRAAAASGSPGAPGGPGKPSGTGMPGGAALPALTRTWVDLVGSEAGRSGPAGARGAAEVSVAPAGRARVAGGAYPA